MLGRRAAGAPSRSPGSKKWKRDGSTASSTLTRAADAAAGIEARREELRLAGDQRRVLVLARLGLRRDARRVDAEERVRLGPELLDDVDVDPQPGQRRGRKPGVLEALGPDPDDDAPEVARGPVQRVEREREAAEGDRLVRDVASTRFIAGEPMNAATKRFAGLA